MINVLEELKQLAHQSELTLENMPKNGGAKPLWQRTRHRRDVLKAAVKEIERLRREVEKGGQQSLPKERKKPEPRELKVDKVSYDTISGERKEVITRIRRV